MLHASQIELAVQRPMVFERALSIVLSNLCAPGFNLEVAKGGFVASNSTVEKLYPDPERVGPAL